MEDSKTDKGLVPYKPTNPNTLLGMEAWDEVDSFADNLFSLHKDLNDESPTVLHLEYSNLDEVMMRHCYNVVATGMFLGQLKRKLTKTRRQMQALARHMYKQSTDNILRKPTLPSGQPDTKAKSTPGLQKYDAEYRAAEYSNDPRYIQLQEREELLIEQIETVESLKQAQRDKASFILGMQKAINQTI